MKGKRLVGNGKERNKQALDFPDSLRSEASLRFRYATLTLTGFPAVLLLYNNVGSHLCRRSKQAVLEKREIVFWSMSISWARFSFLWVRRFQHKKTAVTVLLMVLHKQYVFDWFSDGKHWTKILFKKRIWKIQWAYFISFFLYHWEKVSSDIQHFEVLALYFFEIFWRKMIWTDFESSHFLSFWGKYFLQCFQK